MISYKLAKQLKDAGYKFEHDEQCDVQQGIGEDCYCISLSELIEACGDKFEVMGRTVSGGWWVTRDDATFYGDSPEEAVAEAWLELNQK